MGNDARVCNLTRVFLERSQDSPLIDIVAFPRSPVTDGGAWQATEELKQNIHRIRSLSIGANLVSQLEHLLDTVLKDQVPPSLICISLLAQPQSSYPAKLNLIAEPSKTNFIRLCNQLQSLEMNSVWADFDSYSFARLERLTLDVSFGFLSTVDCLLPLAPELRFLEIRDIATWRVRERTDPEPSHGVKMLRLRHPHSFCRWELQEETRSKHWDVIDFHLPHNLTAGPKAETRRNLECLVPYMRANSSNITSLTLRNDRPEVLERISFMLQVLPNLHTLTFDKLRLTESILSLFVPLGGSSGTFLRLHTLRLLLSEVHNVDMLKTLISSHPIRRLDLWRSKLNWGDGTIGRDYRPVGPSPFYEWLCERVPELYI